MDELTLADYLAIFGRWKGYFFSTFLVLMTLSIAIALFWSNYRSTATVEIEQPQVAAAMTTPTGMNPQDMSTSLADLRISKILQKVTAPASLVDIITKFNLYADARQTTPMDVVAKKMADKIKLDLISSTIANPAALAKVSVDQLSAIAFTLSYDYKNPQVARQVLSELTTRFLDEDLKQRRQEAEATSDFLNNQSKVLESSLAEQEEKIAQFKNEYGVSGPELLMFNQQAAASVSMNLQNLNSQIATNEGTQGTLRAQLSTLDPYSRVIADGQLLTTPSTQLKALESQYAFLTSQYGPEHPDVLKVKNQINALRQERGMGETSTATLKAQIKDVETNLAAAQKTYGPENPDVKSLNRQKAKLNEQLAAARQNAAESAGLKKDADNPTYLGFVAQLNALEEQHKALLEQRQSLTAQLSKYEAAITKNPGLEQQMAVLSRDHDNALQRYREIKERKMAADMDVQMILDHKSEHLVVISPPDLPLHTHPRQIILLIGGFVLSIMGGFAAILAAMLLNQTIDDVHHLTSLIGIAPLVTIPHLYSQEELRRSPLKAAWRRMTRRTPKSVVGGWPQGEI